MMSYRDNEIDMLTILRCDGMYSSSFVSTLRGLLFEDLIAVRRGYLGKVVMG